MVALHVVLGMLAINLTNLVGNSLYSIMDAFFPQQAEAKLLSPEAIGAIFAAFPAVVFLTAPSASRLMDRIGTRTTFLVGCFAISIGTLSFSAALILPDGAPFAAWCMVMRLLQGAGGALEEASAYVLIASLAGSNVTFYLGLTELSTGLGYMLGPPIGAVLYMAGGFPAPFISAACALLLASYAAFACFRLSSSVPKDVASVEMMPVPQLEDDTEGMRGEGRGDAPLPQSIDAGRAHARALLTMTEHALPESAPEGARPAGASAAETVTETERRATSSTIYRLISHPEIWPIALAAAVANSDYAFLEPTLGDHALANGQAADADGVGLQCPTCHLSATDDL
jgi:MFS family permease